MKDLHQERCTYTSTILEDLIARGDEEALNLIGSSTGEGIAGNVLVLSYPFSTL